MNKPAALYARVSSDRQKETHTIASQVAALTQYAETNGYLVPPEWQFQDDGYVVPPWSVLVWRHCGTSRRR
ncbi:MAG TPA: recombinase family protein, partial [Terriglobales bacterium]|nr:recombinase family protein [Terriglobales bacterium]